jgi:hypothetical protein
LFLRHYSTLALDVLPCPPSSLLSQNPHVVISTYRLGKIKPRTLAKAHLPIPKTRSHYRIDYRSFHSCFNLSIVAFSRFGAMCKNVSQWSETTEVHTPRASFGRQVRGRSVGMRSHLLKVMVCRMILRGRPPAPPFSPAVGLSPTVGNLPAGRLSSVVFNVMVFENGVPPSAA